MAEVLTEQEISDLLMAIAEDAIAENPNITVNYRLDKELEFDTSIKEKEEVKKW